MKIKQKIILSDLIIGIIPVFLAFSMLAVVFTIQADEQVRNNLEQRTAEIRSKIESRMENYQNYSYLFSRMINITTFQQLQNISEYGFTIKASMYNIKLLEFAYSNQIAKSEFEDATYCPYASSQRMVDFMWNWMNAPFNTPEFKMSFPDPVSNILVIRNVAMFYIWSKVEKLGLAITSFPLDETYLKSIVEGYDDLIVFIETENGVLTSDSQFNENPSIVQSIVNANINDDKRNVLLNMESRGQYYLYKTPLFKMRDKVVSYIGILYGFDSVNNTISLFYKISIVVFFASIIIASIIALMFAGQITGSILLLKEKVVEFKNNFKAIEPPKQVKDEIDILQDAFADMSHNIVTYTESIVEFTHNLNEANQDLKRANTLINRELDIARKVQQSIIPKTFPGSEILNFGGVYIPMEALGGDYYDVFYIGKTKIGIIMADVSGHGVPSALITSMAKMSFINNSNEEMNTAEIVAKVNRDLTNSIGDIDDTMMNFYLTAFYGIIDLEKGVLEYTNAGHVDIYIIHEDLEYTQLSSNSFVIGTYFTADYACERVELKKGDRIVLYTDGIIEARNDNNEFFGEDRFLGIIREDHMPAIELSQRIIDEVNLFKGDHPVHDDITLLIVEILSNKWLKKDKRKKHGENC